jgi:dolichol-phosphate mannosyltransferase
MSINSEPDYSIIVALYNEEDCIANTFHTINNEVIKKNPDKTGEILFIDDGSTDNSLEILLKLREEHTDTIKIIKFSRNFGQVAASMAGFENFKGKCLASISADMQDPPELINEMLRYHFEEGYDIVISARKDRDESWFRRFSSRFFYSVIRKLSFPDMPTGGFDYYLASRRVITSILHNDEKNPFVQGQIMWAGFKKKFMEYKRADRKTGKSKWTFSKKIKYLIDGIMSYSYLPIRIMTFLGLITSCGGFIYAIIVLIGRLTGNFPFKGWAPIMIVVLVLSGIQMLMLGLIGEYLWRTLDQVRKRQTYIIEEIYE